MSPDAEEERQAVEFSHELLIRRDGETSAVSTQQSVATTPGETSLNLAQGENWLRLVVSLDHNAVLQDTQETSVGVKPFPSISSLSEVGTIDAPTEDCFICIDVDGPYVTIKDMRVSVTSQEEKMEAVFDICIARRKQRLQRTAIQKLADSQASDDDTEEKYHPLETLGRRQLRMLHEGDRIVTRSNLLDGETEGLVLEYQCTDKSRGGEESQGSYILEVGESQAHIGASLGSEVSKPSDRPQTQAEGHTPLQTQEVDYTTAFEVEQTQDSDDETTSYDGECDATQAFPRPSLLATQSPERKNSSDEASTNLHQPESEKDPPDQDAQDVAMGDQAQGSNHESFDLDQSTQRMSTPERAEKEPSNGRDVASDLHQLSKGGDALSPIAEISTATKENDYRDDSEKPKGPTETDPDGSDNQENLAWEEDMDSESDALLDEEDIKDASVGVDATTPQKPPDVKQEQRNSAEVVDPPKVPKSNASAPVDEAMSGSSSITEVDEESPVKETAKKGGAVEVTKDLPSGLGDDVSHSSSITEADEMLSPRKGLVTLTREDEDNEKPSGETSRKEPAVQPTSNKDEAEDSAAIQVRGAKDVKVPNMSNRQFEVDEAANGTEAQAEQQNLEGCSVTESSSREERTKDSVLTKTKEIADAKTSNEFSLIESEAKISDQKGGSEEAVVGVHPSEPNQSIPTKPMAKTSSEEVGTAAAFRGVETMMRPSGTCIDNPPSSNTPSSLMASHDEVQSSTKVSSAALKDSLHSFDENEATMKKSPTLYHHNEPAGVVGTKSDREEEGYLVGHHESEEFKKTRPDGTPVRVQSRQEEAKGVEEAVYPDSPHEPDDKNGESVAAPISIENGGAEAKSAEKEGSSDTVKLPEEEAPDGGELPATKTPRRTRRKASSEQTKPQQEQGNEESLRNPSRKRSRKKATPEDAEPEQVDRETEDSATPAKRRNSRKDPPKQTKPEEAENEETLKTPGKKRTGAGHTTRGSAMKRTRSTTTPMSPGEEQVHVLMTGVDATAKHKKVSEKLLCMFMTD